MRKYRMFGIVTVLLLMTGAMACLPVAADHTSKTEMTNPSEVYYNIEGSSYGENKTAMMGFESASMYNVTVDMSVNGTEKSIATSVSFPYVKYNWTIDSWYRTTYGLRFYDVSFHGEQILYDYRIPWVKVNGMKYNLSSDIRVDGPDLYVYSSSKVFKVWVKYRIESINVDVQTYCYFFENGEMDPWAVVDCHGTSRNIIVPERFDFDLGGSDDDNALKYTSHPLGNTWDLITVEGSYSDAGQPESNGIQWQLFDTDRQGLTYVVDQRVDVEPYHTDDPYLTVLRYHGDQVGGDPASYDNDESTGAYDGSSIDPYYGYDLVDWYVAVYGSVSYCNPGPWMSVVV